jgi:hypothetical protein
MGEAKRRQEQDPNFGNRPKEPPENAIAKRLKGFSRGDWILWGLFLGSSVFLTLRVLMQA